MKTTRKLTSACMLAAMLTTSTLAHADALDDNMVVRDSHGNIVHSYEHGTCARTKWEQGSNPCAPATPPVKQVQAPVVRTVLSQEDKTVYFGFDSAALNAQTKQQLNEVATTLSTARDVRSADIVGYADSMGNAAYNQALSRKRAQAVKDYLATRGYLNTQVADVRGVGETGSVTQCDTSLPRDEKIACLSADRRVEVEVQYVTTEPAM